ncbi:MAG: SGNH/GDSL hydrolase family protein [Alphaproteobacteria bacterium]|nr:SGNH/GDSL hydrolase family protein [Alphaproteobacteria bacterium SS10]
MIIQTLRALLLLPVIIPQAIWVRRNATRMPEAAGPRHGMRGNGPPLRILVIGDSSAAGVGAEHQDQALTGQLVRQLEASHQVTWRIIAKSGGTVASTLEMLTPVPAEAFDVAVTALGVNDAKNGVSMATWQREYGELLDLLEHRFGVTKTIVSGLPPVRHFPLLPWPLKLVLGERSEQFDRALAKLADKREKAAYLPLNFTLDISHMASDGFHPGPAIYAEWAEGVAALIEAERTT